MALGLLFLMPFFFDIGPYGSQRRVGCEFHKYASYYEKQKSEATIQVQTEQIVEMLELLGIDSSRLTEYSADILSEVFDFEDMEYFAGIKLFNKVIDRLGVDMDQQKRYEVFDRIYEAGMREKKVERDRNGR